MMPKTNKSWFIVSVFVFSLGISAVYGFEKQLEGKRAKCQAEGERVAVDKIDKRGCFSCICKNGFVECSNDQFCSRTDECHLIVEDGGCCKKKCKGCMYKGKYYHSHTEWTDSDQVCRELRCEAGVITVSDVLCYTPCANPLPPEPGKCCGTCPECKINGQIASDDRDVIPDDPCLKCRCSKGRMICSKKACPVLQCKKDRQVQNKEDCCPRCVGTRSLITPPKSCTIQDSFYHEGQHHGLDRYTNCTCINETSICRRYACPVLDCPADFQESRPGRSCKECVMRIEEARTQCSYAGKYYEDGQSWKLDACSSCKCNGGRASCAKTKCNDTVPCPPGTTLKHTKGECCAKCHEVDGVCMVFGDPHYKTFDGKMYSFKGVGKYQLTADCEQNTFSIRVANTQVNNLSSTITKRVAVRFGDNRLNLQQKGRVKLNGKRIQLPYKMEGKVRIEKINNNVQVVLQNGVKLLWNGKSFLEVSIPATYKNKVCGLCGNFNKNVQDDFKPRRGRLLKDNETSLFGQSWCVGKRTDCKQNNVKSTCTAHRTEKNRCKFLNSPELFGTCESIINSHHYYKACKSDMCNCPDGICYCEYLLAYSRECERSGVQLSNWQKYSYCDANSIKRMKHRNNSYKKISRRPTIHFILPSTIQPNKISRTSGRSIPIH